MDLGPSKDDNGTDGDEQQCRKLAYENGRRKRKEEDVEEVSKEEGEWKR